MADTELQEHQRQLAMQNGFAILKAIETDAKRLRDRRASLKEALARVDIDWKAFQEAIKRAKQNEHTLNLFDQSCMEIEGWARKLIAGEKLVEADASAEDDKDPPFEEDEGGDLTEEAEEDPAPPPQPQPEEPAAPEPVPAAAESATEGGIQFEDDGAATSDKDTPSDEPEWDMGGAPAADPRAAEKTARVAPAAGAAGVSMDDIPMPQSQIHDLQQEQAKRTKRGFVDRRERMTADEYNESVKAGSAQP